MNIRMAVIFMDGSPLSDVLPDDGIIIADAILFVNPCQTEEWEFVLDFLMFLQKAVALLTADKKPRVMTRGFG